MNSFFSYWIASFAAVTPEARCTPIDGLHRCNGRQKQGVRITSPETCGVFERVRAERSDIWGDYRAACIPLKSPNRSHVDKVPQGPRCVHASMSSTVIVSFMRPASWTAPLYRSYKLEAQARESLTLKYTRSRFVLVFVGFRIQSDAVQLGSVVKAENMFLGFLRTHSEQLS